MIGGLKHRVATFFTTAELADQLRVSPRTLEAWRLRSLGPPFVKLGSRVLYDAYEVEDWLDDQRRPCAAG